MLLVAALTIVTVGLFAQGKAGKTDTTKHQAIYTCPMHDTLALKKPGNCPICGMKLQLSNKEQMKRDLTKNYSCPMHPKETSHNPAKCPICGKNMHLSAKEQMKAEVTKIYTCPMHPEVALDKEGKCPKCGTALVEKKKSKKG